MKWAFKQNSQAAIYLAIVVLLALPFLTDLVVARGTSVWVAYLLPLALAYYVWRPEVPLVVAAAATVLVIVGYFNAPPGIDPAISRVNRTIGIVTAWAIAASGYMFIRSRIATRANEWFQAGQVGLARNAGGEQRLDELGESILRFLVAYLEATAGALFIRDGNAFRRIATFGVPADARIPESVGPGDGLVGEAIRDGKSFTLNDVPDGYLYYGTSLGRGRPRHLLVAPAAVDSEINAVVELGFARNVNQNALPLLERVGEQIAVAIRSARYRTRLQELLEETQRQAEELQSQSTQLRTANDELEEQARSLQESQTKLEQQQTELEQANAQLEEQTRLLEAQRDDLARTQTSLRSESQKLADASRYKSEFLANMSHELRTPLNSLLILARLLADNRAGNLSSEQVKYARTIESSGNDLLGLINDILDISKIEAGRVDLHPEAIPIAHLLQKLKDHFQSVATEKGLQLSTEIAAGTPSDLVTDSQRLEQVLKNFMSNALKFTEKGEVVLSAAKRPDDKVAFTVRDTGIGIPPEQHHVIFEAFRQADGTINRKFGGTGLGLSISRELTRLLGGEIVVDSAVGRGSAFTLVVPQSYDPKLVRSRDVAVIASAPHGAFAPPDPAAELPLSPRPGSARRTFVPDDRDKLSVDKRIVLVVEDDPTFARILLDLAHELDIQCLVADTADEGVLLARQYLPHAVLLDIELPDHSGLSVLDRLKHDVRTRHIPVHVVSVGDYTHVALSSGAAGFMLKPVKRERLIQALENLETRLSQRMRQVLIVEDDADQLESIRLLLASHDVQTVGVSNAAACLEQLKARSFDCMVVDLTLPDVSGFDLLEQLSQDDSLAFPPVIVYTGRDLTAEQELKLRRLSKSIIIKGARSPERLLDEVTLFLHQVVADLPERQRAMLAQSLNRDAALEGRRVLVVEDDVRNVFAVTGILEPHGVQVQIARNGREALAALERAETGGAQSIDLVLMDVMMPEMDGLTATREIRKRSQWRNLPIIVLTAKAMKDDQQQCLAAGANDYLAKPLDVDKLLSLVRVWMPR